MNKMGFFEAIKTCCEKYADFSGRASRAEYWWFQLLTCSINLVLNTIAPYIGDGVYLAISLLYIFVFTIPSLAVAWRRMHDVGKSGFVSFIPIYNFIMAVSKGDAGENKYGPVP